MRAPPPPSMQAAYDLFDKKEGATAKVIGSFLARGLMIAVGLYIFGERDRIWQNAFAASATVGLFVLTWTARHS